MNNSNNFAIQTVGLSKTFGNFKAVDNLLMDIKNFRKEQHQILDNKGFSGVSEVLNTIENSNFSYNKAMLANLRTQATQPLTALMLDPYISQIRSFIDSLKNE